MKKINAFTIIICFTFLIELNAQQGYSYTLIDNGNQSYTISSVPSTSFSEFNTSVQSHGFTIILPDGITATITSSLGGIANAEYFDGNSIGEPNIDGYLITEVFSEPISLPSPSTETILPMATIQINGSPTSGSISLLSNNSSLANTIIPLKSFMAADMIDNEIANYPNVINLNNSGLTGITKYNFGTLNIEEQNIIEFSLIPNPASELVKINLPKGITDAKIEIFDTLGKQITINISEKNTFKVDNLPSGLYLVSITTNETKTTKKLIVK